ncbi:MAG TPA: hypothetical protein VM577_21155 [Anaerovoracaceae bacterium]|nr:hypothetical protein [Anaerovoracaceae bacterium]
MQTPDVDTLASQGSAVLIDCHQWHAYSVPKHCEFTYVHFDGCTSQALYNHIVQRRGNVFPAGEKSTIPSYLRLLLSGSRNSKIVSEVSFSQTIYSLLSDIISAPQNESLSGGKAQIIGDAVGQIAFQVGYTSENSFITSFAGRVGIPPGKFRKLFRTSY